jgi:chromosome partitioning protein
MISIGLVSQKGGAGKTTLAIHLAVLAHEAGLRAVLIDCDPQRSAVWWRRRREEREPVMVEAAARDLPAVLDTLRADGYQIALIDTVGHADQTATASVRAVDFVLIPCRPAALDIAAAVRTVDLVQAIRKPAAIVLNACPPGQGVFEASLTVEARADLRSYGLPVAPAAIGNRVDFSHALISGDAVTEFRPKGKAAEELRKLWAWLQGEVH